jgi:Phage integrase, N-terminal SAM-like domain
MEEDKRGQYESGSGPGSQGKRAAGFEAVVPNPKLKLMDQVREVMRLKHYAIRTETCYCDWIRRFVRFHGMKSRADLSTGTAKIEEFLSDMAVNGHVAVSTQNLRGLPLAGWC